MRKRILFLVVLLLLFFGIVYFAIPNTISVSERANLSLNEKAFARVFFNENTWSQWWPGKENKGSGVQPSFAFNNKKYSILAKRFTSLLLSVSENGDSVLTEVFLVPVRAKRIEIAWVSTVPTGTNPVTRIKRYLVAKNLAADLHAILQHLETYYTNDDKLYGFQIQETLVLDSLLVSTAKTLKNKPTTDDVYTLVDKLKTFIEKNGAKETSEPMLNVTPVTDGDYLTRVAIPVNKALNGEGDVQFKKMLGQGNILTATVKGGPETVKNAFAQMAIFVSENDRTAPAIPFEKLITNRRAEPDTSKWVTKLYWPVM